ncbi:Hypothetical protein NTJ_11405 [Nesidiocoris tenuis]|uniref:Nucleoprotein n=1 Tax=Nesidiocoris tenuis TaxID=355587 RepID=A0ABN7B2E1_9HEMI|nr:Hypothetical protein NTJ_11405 [Nesidiocoris tenuis]
MLDPPPTPGTSMEVNLESPAPTKKTTVNVDEPNVWRNQYLPNETLKKQVVAFLVHAHLMVGNQLGVTDLTDLTKWTNVSSVVENAHNALRLEASPVRRGKIGEKLKDILGEDGKTVKLKVEDLKTTVRELAASYDLLYTYNPNKREHWWGMAAPYLSLMNLFKHRLNEVRNGCEYFPIYKSSTEIEQVGIGQYGLNGAHHILLDGISYPPRKRYLAAHSLGPMTQLIMLAQCRGTTDYSAKWKLAVTRSLAHLPRSNEIPAYVSGKQAIELVPLFMTIADTLLLTGSRSMNKAFFPICFYFTLLEEKYINAARKEKPPKNLLTDAAPWEKIDFSGNGAQTLWKLNLPKTFQMKSHLPNNQLAQYIFHGVWGTHWEDLELLRWMTGREFVDRRTFGEGFRKTSEAGYQSVRMIPFLYYYKRAQALTTRFTCPRNRLGQQQVSNKVTFAGKRTIPLTKSLTSYMGKSANWQVYETVSLLAALAKHKERVFNEFSKEGVRNLGTTDWYKSDTCSFEEHGEKVEPPTFNRSKLFKGALEDE